MIDKNLIAFGSQPDISFGGQPQFADDDFYRRLRTRFQEQPRPPKPIDPLQSLGQSTPPPPRQGPDNPAAGRDNPHNSNPYGGPNNKGLRDDEMGTTESYGGTFGGIPVTGIAGTPSKYNTDHLSHNAPSMIEGLGEEEQSDGALTRSGLEDVLAQRDEKADQKAKVRGGVGAAAIGLGMLNPLVGLAVQLFGAKVYDHFKSKNENKVTTTKPTKGTPNTISAEEMNQIDNQIRENAQDERSSKTNTDHLSHNAPKISSSPKSNSKSGRGAGSNRSGRNAPGGGGRPPGGGSSWGGGGNSGGGNSGGGPAGKGSSGPGGRSW